MKRIRWISRLLITSTLVATICLLVAFTAVRVGLDYMVAHPVWLNEQLNRYGPVPISFDDATIQWKLPVPVITISSLQAQVEGVDITIENLEIRPQIVASLIQLQLVTAFAYGSGVTVDIDLDTLLADEEQTSIDEIVALALSLASTGTYLVEDVHVRIDSQDVYIDSLVSAANSGWVFSLNGSIPHIAEKIRIGFQQKDNLPLDTNLNGQIYVHAELVDNAFAGSLITLPIEELNGNTSLWLELTDGLPTNIQGNFEHGHFVYNEEEFSSVNAGFAARTLFNSSLLTPFTFDNIEQLAVNFAHIDYQFRNEQFTLRNVFFSTDAENQGNVFFSVSDGQLDPIVPILATLLPQSRSRIEPWLIRGNFNQLRGTIPIANPLELEATMSIPHIQVGSDANEIVQISTSNVQATLRNKSALLHIHSQTQTTIFVPSVYDKPIFLDNLTSEFHIDWSSSQIRFGTENAIGQAFTTPVLFSLTYQLDTQYESASTFNLQVTFEDIAMIKKDTFIPYQLMPDDLAKTIQNLSRTGKISGDLLVFLQPGSESVDTTLLWSTKLDIADSSIFIDKQYPRAKKVHASTYLDGEDLNVYIHSAQLLNTAINDVSIKFDIGKNEIRVNGQIKETVQEIINVAQSLGIITNNPLPDEIATEGRVQVKFAVFLPLGETKKKPTYGLTVTLLDNALYLQSFSDMPITNINGRVFVSTDTVTQKAPITARFSGKELVVDIQTVEAKDISLLRLKSSFYLPAELLNQLANFDEPLLSGFSHVDTLLDFNLNTFSLHRVHVTSNLNGMGAFLPLRLGKRQNETVDSEFVLERYSNTKTLLYLNVQDRVKGNMLLTDDGDANGWIGIGRPAEGPIAVSENELQIIAGYDLIDVEELIAWFRDKNLQQIMENATSAEETDTLKEARSRFIANLLDNISVDFRASSIGTGDFFITQVTGKLLRQNKDWILSIDSNLLTAEVEISPYGEVVHINIDKLIIPEFEQRVDLNEQRTNVATETTDDEFIDPLADFDPRIIGQVQLTINKLVYIEQDLGAWEIQIEPDENGLKMTRLVAAKDDIQVNASAFWHFDEFAVSGQKQRTVADLSIEGKGVEKLLQVLDSERAFIQTTFSWNASPLGVNLQNVNGSIELELVDGSLRTDTGSVTFLNLIGLLNIEAIAKRLSLDFTDQGKNLAFNKASGKMNLREGIMYNTEPFIVNGTSFDMEVNGTTNLVNGELDQSIFVSIPVGEALPLATLLAGFTPQFSVILLIANYALAKPFEKLTSARFKATGTIADPKLILEQIFNAKREKISLDLLPN